MRNRDKSVFGNKTVNQSSSDSCKRFETRLLLPSAFDPKASEAALERVMEAWLLPTLLEEFLKKHGVSPKKRFFSITP
jgi:hypothetical protein